MSAERMHELARSSARVADRSEPPPQTRATDLLTWAIVSDPRRSAPRSGLQTTSLRGGNHPHALETASTVEMMPIVPRIRLAGGSGAVPAARGARRPRQLL